LGWAALWHAAGCRKPDASPGIVIQHEIAPWPARVGDAVVTLIVSDAASHAVSGARIALEADMSHAGMRPEFGETREIGAGRYQGRLAFTMPGDWVLIMHITLPGGEKLERQLDVNGVR
jgi:hypothetical protein